MRLKGYLFCKCSNTEDMSIECLRLFAEKLFGEAECSIKRCTFIFQNEKKKSVTKTLQYTMAKKSKFDSMPLDVCTFMMFRSPYKLPDVLDDYMCLSITHKDGGTYFVRVTWTIEEYSEEEFLKKVTVFRNLLQINFMSDYLFAGCIAPEKDADLFLLGMLTDSRTTFENNVARNIQKATYLDQRMPYLFPYTFCAYMSNLRSYGTTEKKTLLFRSLITESLELYSSNSKWQEYHDLLMEHDLVIPV